MNRKINWERQNRLNRMKRNRQKQLLEDPSRPIMQTRIPKLNLKSKEELSNRSEPTEKLESEKEVWRQWFKRQRPKKKKKNRKQKALKQNKARAVKKREGEPSKLKKPQKKPTKSLTRKRPFNTEIKDKFSVALKKIQGKHAGK